VNRLRRRLAGLRPTRRLRLKGRLQAQALLFASWLAIRLPEGLLISFAEFAGDLWYRATPDRAAQARRNLRRVARWLATEGRGSVAVRAAAEDPRALERLVRRAYRHAARYYLEVARTPGLDGADIDRLMSIETPDTVAEAFVDPPVIFVGLHFGSIELPALFLAERVGGAVAPMETIDDPDLQGWFVRTRGAAGVRIVGLREARRELLRALREGTSVGLVGDRDLTGGGTPIRLFGAPAMLPLGPAMLAVESGARPYVVGVRRVAGRRYIGRLERIAVPADGTRRERVTATGGAIARAFERIVEDAPDQWWAIFFPIWPDLEAAAPPETPRATTDPIEPATIEPATTDAIEPATPSGTPA
jgi:KDO2-lipid IV(A) lauroyltransferase